MLIDCLRDGLFDHLPTIHFVPVKTSFHNRADLGKYPGRRFTVLEWKLRKDIERNLLKTKIR